MSEASPSTPSRSWWKRAHLPLVAGIAAAALIGGVIGALIVDNANDSGSSTNAVCTSTAVATKALPSVVTISASNGTNGGTGSGELIKDGGYILTNDHVISIAGGTGGSVSVLFSDGRSSPATIVGRDPDTDLAVLKAEDHWQHLPLIAIGSSADVRVGQPVVALGAPLGLSSTVTAGIISALDRALSVPVDEGQAAHLVGALQTDASINPGNSGGALVDCDSHLVGVNTAIATVPNANGDPGGGSVGIGFAIPVDLAIPLSEELIEHGRVNHPTFGMQAQVIPREIADQTGATPGLYVQHVTAGGPAEQAGIKVGDVITRVDGQAANSTDALVIPTLTRSAGDVVEVTYERDGESHTTKVTLAAQP